MDGHGDDGHLKDREESSLDTPQNVRICVDWGKNTSIIKHPADQTFILQTWDSRWHHYVCE